MWTGGSSGSGAGWYRQYLNAVDSLSMSGRETRCGLILTQYVE
jgi:hypothetical protein